MLYFSECRSTWVSVFLDTMFYYFSECRATCVCIPVHHVLLFLWVQGHLCLYSCTPCSTISLSAGPPVSVFLYTMLYFFRLCFCSCVSGHQALLLWLQVDRSVLLLPAGSICIPARHVLLVQALLLWLQVDGSIVFLHTMFCYLGCASAVVFLYVVFS